MFPFSSLSMFRTCLPTLLLYFTSSEQWRYCANSSLALPPLPISGGKSLLAFRFGLLQTICRRSSLLEYLKSKKIIDVVYLVLKMSSLLSYRRLSICQFCQNVIFIHQYLCGCDMLITLVHVKFNPSKECLVSVSLLSS